VQIPTQTLHGDKEQADRLMVLEKFRAGTVRVLIATDVSARGIDIAKVDYVINYDLPDVAENYVHRVGRTGRGTHKGQAISFCSPEERPMLDEIETYLTQPIRIMEVSKREYAETIELTEDVPNKWKAVMQEIAEAEQWKKKKKR